MRLVRSARAHDRTRPWWFLGSLPTTPDDQLANKQFLLVTHNMIRTGKKNVDRYNVFRGKPRDLVIYDESMLVADASSLRSWHVRQASDWLSNFIAEYSIEGRWDHLVPIEQYIRDCRDLVTDEYSPKIVTLPELSNYGVGLEPDNATAMLPDGYPSTLRVLLQQTASSLRLMREASRAIGWFQLKVPEELKRVMVLDAYDGPRRDSSWLSASPPTSRPAQPRPT
jgi:hypothetical protein